ncbi:MAG: 3-hydroxyacyl-ACP dehydratase FabZ [Pseudomonadota bacterium]
MMDSNQIKEYLPHRYPFLFIDRVVELVPDEYIVCYKNVSYNEPFFQGHFPIKPIMPGVLIVEAMAQAAGILGLRSRELREGGERNPRVTYLLAGVDNARFKRQVVPGDRLEFRATLGSSKRGIHKFTCEASVDGQQVASVELLVAEREVV